MDGKDTAVTLMTRAKVKEAWIRKPAVYGKNGRVVPGLVIIDGEELRCADASYDLRWYDRGKPKYRPAGKNASDAEEQRKTLARQLTLKRLAQKAGVVVEVAPERKSIRQWRTEYANKRSQELGEDQIQRIRYASGLFLESCNKQFLDELTQSDFEVFLDRLRAMPLFRSLRRKPSNRRNAVQRRLRNPAQRVTISVRTIFNYYIVVCKWLKVGGVDPRLMPPPPKFEEPEVTVYTAEQTRDLFSLVTGMLRIALSLMLKCGLRRKEVEFAYFSDINWQDKTILVRGKPEWKFTVKNRIQRYVPIPDDLLLELKEWEAAHPRQTLIVPKPNGKPEDRLLRTLKRFVYLHGLRCGRCHHCMVGHPECEEWELHKFRRTYATALVRHVDLRTAQRYLGHKRITSTERYLRAASAADGQKRVSGIDFTKPFYESDDNRVRTASA